MEQITNPYHQGQEVVCISEDFPIWKTTSGNKSEIGRQACIHPKKGEHLVIDEILGDFVRFEIYDYQGFNWWHHSRFRLPQLHSRQVIKIEEEAKLLEK